MSDASPPLQPTRWSRRLALGTATGIVLLALTETVSALVAPYRAPDDADWKAAAAVVRAQFRSGDLIVTAPAWADAVMRLHLGDLVPPSVAGRLDGARYPRVWEISQRGGRAPEAADGKSVLDRRQGGLRVRLYQRPASRVTFDFVEQWQQARVVRREPARGEIPCERHADRHQCPDIDTNFVKPRILEIGFEIHRALYAQAVGGGASVVIEYPGVPMGRELAVGEGLANNWYRYTKGVDGTVVLRVLVDGKELARPESSNDSGWRIHRIDTAAWAGKTATVRFEMSSARPQARHFGFAAEARGL